MSAWQGWPQVLPVQEQQQTWCPLRRQTSSQGLRGQKEQEQLEHQTSTPGLQAQPEQPHRQRAKEPQGYSRARQTAAWLGQQQLPQQPEWPR